VPHMCYMLCPSHSSWFDHPNNIWCGGQIIKLLTTYYSPFTLTYPSKTQTLPSAPYSQTHSAYVPPSMWAVKFHTHTTASAVAVI
jgi:hypothetical protein